MAHEYYKSSGIVLSNAFRINYEEQETITLQPNYPAISGFSYNCTWNFYKSTDKSLIKTVTSTVCNVSFTRTEGQNGIDVELIIDYGINRTRFYKRHRIVTMPNCSSLKWSNLSGQFFCQIYKSILLLLLFML